MKPLVPLQSSLQSRLIFLFGLLVTIPLAVAGVLLSLTGRDSVLFAGEELRRVGEETFRQSAARLEKVATRGADHSSQRLIAIGQDQLQRFGRDQVSLSASVLRDSNQRLSRTATKTLRAATERMAGTSDAVIVRSSDKLRQLQASAVEEVSGTLIKESRQAFEATGQQLVQANQDSMNRLLTELNHERARRMAEQTQNLLAQTYDIVTRVTTGQRRERGPATTPAAGVPSAATDPANSPPRPAADAGELPRPPLERLVQGWSIRLRQSLPVPILWARLYIPPDRWVPAPSSEPRTPGATTPPLILLSPEEEEALPLPTSTAARAARSGRSGFSTIDFALDNPAPRTTLFVPVTLAPGSAGVFAVRLSLDFLAREVSPASFGEGGRAPAFVASLSEGRIIAHSDVTRVGTPVLPEEQVVLTAARQLLTARLPATGTMVRQMPGAGTALCAFATISLPAPNVEARAGNRAGNHAPSPGRAGEPSVPGDPAVSARRLARELRDTHEDQGGDWVVVTLRPHSEVIERSDAMQRTIERAARRAADSMEAEGRRQAAALVAAAVPAQRRIAQAAAARVRSENQARVAAAVTGLARQQQQIAQAALRQTRTRSASAAAVAQQRMREQARLAAARATDDLREQTGRSARTGLMHMQALVSSTANEAAAHMVKNSLWLIAVFLTLAFLCAMVTARSLVRPISALAAGTAAIASGDFTRRVPVQSRDELGALALAFNHMADAVQRGREALETSNETLAREKQRIQAIVQSSPDGLMIVTEEQEATLLNPSARRLLNLPANTPHTLDFTQLHRHLPGQAVALFEEGVTTTDDRPPTTDGWWSEKVPDTPGAMGRSRATGGRTRDETSEVGGRSLVVVQQDPHEARDLVLEAPHRVLQVRCVPITGEARDEGGVLIHLHDVTREREIDEMKSSFVSLVSHELRTPLTSILGFSSYMLTGKLGSITEAQRTGLESIHRQANRLKAIISDFLDISRIEAGKMEMLREPVPVAEVALRVIEELHPQAMEKGLEVTFAFNGHDGDGTALADEERLTQVLTNLLGNALKFTGPGGQVTVALDREEDQVRVHVRDTGMGIPEEELPRIFDRFYQVEKVATRKAGGTGLGLSIVKSIVEAMGGAVIVESRLGEGTSFIVSLPAAS